MLATCVLALTLLLHGLAGAQERQDLRRSAVHLQRPDKYQYLARGHSGKLVSP
jgi:hypothetical protein